MKQNMGFIDRFLRLIIAIVIVLLYYNNTIYGTVAYVLLVLACIFISTAVVGICPLYLLFGIDTGSKQKTSTTSNK